MKQSDIEVAGRILMAIPDVQESTLHGHRSFKTRGKLLACPAIHKSVEANSLVVRLPAEERDRLLAEQPRTYYVTDHYARNSVVLVRLSKIDRNLLRSLLERACGLLTQDRRNSGAKPRKAVPAPASAPKKSLTDRSGRSGVKPASG